MMDWNHKDIWTKRGRNFTVEVSRHYVQPLSDYRDEGPHRWCVYAYIYPTHPHFKNFDGDNMWQDAATVLPMHGSPSYLAYPQFEGKTTSAKVGCDYNHLGDNRYTFMATKDDARQVFEDADELFNWLQFKEEPNE